MLLSRKIKFWIIFHLLSPSPSFVYLSWGEREGLSFEAINDAPQYALEVLLHEIGDFEMFGKSAWEGDLGGYCFLIGI